MAEKLGEGTGEEEAVLNVETDSGDVLLHASHATRPTTMGSTIGLTSPNGLLATLPKKAAALRGCRSAGV